MMVKATVPSILNTVRNILIRQYVSVEEVVTMGLVYKIWWLLCSYPPESMKARVIILVCDTSS